MKNYLMLLVFVCGTAVGQNKGPHTVHPIEYQEPCNWVRLGCATSYDVDVFYLYPTSWQATPTDGLYCRIDNASMRSKVPFVYTMQASLFEGFANVYAPWYRQSDAAKILAIPDYEEREAAFGALPYDDAVNAFSCFLTHYNKGKPFILVGHSQGASMIRLLLERYMVAHPEVLKRMVAAYALGYSFEPSYFERNKHLRFAEGECEAGAGLVVGWNCERLENGKMGSYNKVCDRGAMSINPISWTRDHVKVEANDPRNLGSSKLDGALYSVQLVDDSVRGYQVLIVGIDNESLDSKELGDLSLHAFDATLFDKNIVENAKKRIATYKQQ